MKNLKIFLVILFCLIAYRGFTQPLKLRSNSTFTQQDHYLNASRALLVPVHSSFTLDGAINTPGQFVYNTSIGKLGIYKGSGVWDTLSVNINESDITDIRGDITTIQGDINTIQGDIIDLESGSGGGGGTPNLDQVLEQGNQSDVSISLGGANVDVFVTGTAHDGDFEGVRLQLNSGFGTEPFFADRGAAVHLGDDGDLILQTYNDYLGTPEAPAGTWSKRLRVFNSDGSIGIVETPTTASSGYHGLVRNDSDGKIRQIALESGSYTPVGTTSTNVTIVAPNQATYIRIGDNVFVYGSADVTTSASGTSSFYLTLPPISSDFTDTRDLIGIGNSNRINDGDVVVRGNVSLDQAEFNTPSFVTGGIRSVFYNYSYKVF